MLDDIVASVLMAGRHLNEKTQKRKEWQQQWEQRRSQREAADRLQAEGLAWQKELRKLFDEWLRYERLRDFISACEARFAQIAPDTVDEKMLDWLARAKSYAETIDP